MKKLGSLFLAALLILVCAVPVLAASDGSETAIILSDIGVKVDGSAASTSASSAVYTGAEIVYYEAGRGSDYGEGTTADEHSAADAKAHTVVTITKPGTYRVSGTLSKGQIAIDLGENASSDSSAVVTLILDGADITCTVAPAIIFYNVFECGTNDAATASATVNTSKAGANVVIADGSVNNINGSYVARIYKEGGTKKLHKYDGALYSKMSMNVYGGTLGSGVLNITAENEGLDSELHLTINGGIINITAENDGVNTNEDGVSVTTINGGTLSVDGGFGVEGDGIDSNGYLVINGGTIIATANPRTGDGGIDADMDILINGGTVIAFGSRNDAASTSSEQPYMELSYAATQKAGTQIRVEDAGGKEIVTYNSTRDFQSVTISTPLLSLGTTYHVYAGDIRQQYTGTGALRGFGGGMMPGGMTQPDRAERPTQPDGAWQRPEGTGQPPEGFTPPEGFDPGQMPEGFNPGQRQDGMGNQNNIAIDGSAEFTLTAETRSFSGVSDSVDTSGKTAVSFTINNGEGMESGKAELSGISVVMRSNGGTANIPANDIQLTINDVPSENYAKSCLLSDGASAISALLPVDNGTYQLTISVLSQNPDYIGTSQWLFSVGAISFTDVDASNPYYEAIQFVYNAGLMAGTDETSFSPNVVVSRAMAITVLGRLANAETVENSALSDVEEGSWYASYVGWAEKNSIVTGYGNGVFGPNDLVTRQQMCVILYNYAKSAGISLSSAELNYSDSSQIASWATEAVKACASSGLLSKVAAGGTALNPQAALTRAELADMLMRFAQLN